MNSAKDPRETIFVGHCSENSPIVAGGLINTGLSTRLDIGGEQILLFESDWQAEAAGSTKLVCETATTENTWIHREDQLTWMHVYPSMGESKEGLAAWSRSYDAN